MYKKYKPYILIAPALAVLILIFASGLGMGIAQSFGYFPALGLQNLTLAYYDGIFTQPAFREALFFSLYTAFVSSLLAAAAGLFLAYAVMRSPGGGKSDHHWWRIPVTVPHTIAAFMTMAVLGQSGWLSRLGFSLGIVRDMVQFPELLFDPAGVGIIAAYLWKGTPFIAMMMIGVLRSADREYREAAENLGASNRQIFRYIILPLSLPTLLTGFILLFSYSFGAFEIPFLLGPTQPKTLPVMAYLAYLHPDLKRRPFAMAVSVVIAAISFLLVYIYSQCYNWAQNNRTLQGGPR